MTQKLMIDKYKLIKTIRESLFGYVKAIFSKKKKMMNLCAQEEKSEETFKAQKKNIHISNKLALCSSQKSYSYI